jgi:hypothetical protein
MKQPKGYEKDDLVCKLNKALYGTKQAGSGRAWQLKLKGFLETCGFKPSVYDPCCYTMQCKGSVIIMVVWVDDISTAYHCGSVMEFSRRERKLSWYIVSCKQNTRERIFWTFVGSR